MRSSDWSSDVCSSDLLAKVEVRRPSGLARPAEAIYEDIVAAVDAALAGGDRAIVHVVHRSKTGIVVPTWEQVEALAARFGNRVDQIGRASCRERVCQYV